MNSGVADLVDQAKSEGVHGGDGKVAKGTTEPVRIADARREAEGKH